MKKLTLEEVGAKREYAATYKGGKFGKTTVHIVAPPPMSEEEKQRRWGEVMKTAWACWNTLSTEEKLQINAECEAGLLE